MMPQPSEIAFSSHGKLVAFQGTFTNQNFQVYIIDCLFYYIFILLIFLKAGNTYKTSECYQLFWKF